jgi:hypothetical protein
MLSNATLRSPRSTPPIYDRSIPASSANRSWLRPRAWRNARIWLPNRTRRRRIAADDGRGPIAMGPYGTTDYQSTDYNTHSASSTKGHRAWKRGCLLRSERSSDYRSASGASVAPSTKTTSARPHTTAVRTATHGSRRSLAATPPPVGNAAAPSHGQMTHPRRDRRHLAHGRIHRRASRQTFTATRSHRPRPKPRSARAGNGYWVVGTRVGKHQTYTATRDPRRPVVFSANAIPKTASRGRSRCGRL